MILLVSKYSGVSKALDSSVLNKYIDRSKFIYTDDLPTDETIEQSLVISNSRYDILDNHDISLATLGKTDMFDLFKRYKINHMPIKRISDRYENALLKSAIALYGQEEILYNPELTTAIRLSSTARGLGNIKVKVSDLLDISNYLTLYHGHSRNTETYKSLRKYLDTISIDRNGYGDYKGDTELYRLEEALLDSDIELFMQKVLDVEYDEYRLYITSDSSGIVGMKRKGYGLNVNRIDMEDMSIDTDILIADDPTLKELIKKIQSLMCDLKWVVASIDIYKVVDTDTWGVFEISEEFSIEGLTTVDVLKLTNMINNRLVSLHQDKINKKGK